MIPYMLPNGPNSGVHLHVTAKIVGWTVLYLEYCQNLTLVKMCEEKNTSSCLS